VQGGQEYAGVQKGLHGVYLPAVHPKEHKLDSVNTEAALSKSGGVIEWQWRVLSISAVILREMERVPSLPCSKSLHKVIFLIPLRLCQRYCET
jgi:hypothetical protein